MNDNEFDLLIHDWIPCLQVGDLLKLFSIRSALENARQIRSVEHESPVVRVAVLRLLLAFCYRVAYANRLPLCSFRNWKALQMAWKEGVPSQWIDHYLDSCECRDRFRLFDNEYPFFQVAGLQCQGGRQPEAATRLASEQFAGTPSSLWEHLQELPSVRDAALFLVTCQAFGASASNTSNAKVGDLEYSPTGRTFGPIYDGCVIWLEGNDLLETLMLNLVDYDLTDTDLPIWEKPLSISALRARQPQKAKEGDKDNDGKQIRIGKKIAPYKSASPTGPVQLFTWPSRAILLTKPEDGLVKRVHFTQGLTLSDQPVDPMKPYDQKGRPVSFQRHKAAWRDLHSLLAVQPCRNRSVLALSHAARSGLATARLNIAGVARGSEPAKIVLWRHERMPVPAALLADTNLIERLGALLQDAEQAADVLERRARRIATLYLSLAAESADGKRLANDVARVATNIDARRAYWTRLEEHVSALLQGLPNDWDTGTDDWKRENQQAATIAWRGHVKDEARRALEESISALGTTARAIQAAARVRIDFRDEDLKPLSAKAAAEGEAKGGKKK